MTDQTPLQSDELTIALPDHTEAHHDNVVLLLPGSGQGPAVEQPLVVRLREALDASNEMILVIEQSGRVLFANKMARRRLGLASQDAKFPCGRDTSHRTTAPRSPAESRSPTRVAR